MSTAVAARLDGTDTGRAEVLRRLESICRDRDLASLGRRLEDLAGLVHADMASLESQLSLPEGPRAVHRGAAHLLALGGKRLRPMCVALASRIGSGFDARGRALAVSVELVHSATLLHDDVVDLGDTRRGAPSTRAVWGNAVSIFAGDWLLVEALRRVRHAGVPGTLERLLDVIDEMIQAESLQLERRGRLETGRKTWERVVDGKTAALFRWAMYAGGRAGGLADAHVDSLERYGAHLGIAFQAVDDLLDLEGDQRATGKALFADLREGKMTYPLILAMERDRAAIEPLLRAVIEGAEGASIEGTESAASHGHDLDESARFAEIARILQRTGALADCRALAESHAARAVEALATLPEGKPTDALVTVAEATVTRRA
jgi:octaprenyl-diphosphate synthase